VAQASLPDQAIPGPVTAAAGRLRADTRVRPYMAEAPGTIGSAVHGRSSGRTLGSALRGWSRCATNA